MSKVVTYEQLDVWKRAIELVVQVYRVSNQFPRSEMYGLTSQLRRAALSIPANIAEGNCRLSTPAYVNHLNVALGSLGELKTLVEIARRLEFLDAGVHSETRRTLEEVGRLLWGLRRALQVRVNP